MTAPETMPIAIAMQRGNFRESFRPLGNHNFRLYAVAAFLTNTAGWGMRIAVDWLVLELTGNLALVGLTIAIQFTPIAVLGIWGGVLADRFPRRLLLVLSQGSAAVICGVLAALALSGVAQLWMVYVLVGLLGLSAIIDTPARSVLLSEMVGQRQLRNAISLNASNFHLGALIGPAISGVVIGVFGAGWSIVANAVALAVGAVLFAAMRSRDLVPAPLANRAKGQIREALRYVRSKPGLFWPMVMVGFVAVFSFPLPTLLAAMAATEWHSGAQGYGLYIAVLAIGAIAGAMLSTRRSTLRLRTVIFSACIFGVAQAALGLAPSVLVFCGLLIAVGISRLLYSMAGETMIQLSSNLMIRGRVMAIFALIVVGGQAIGGPLMGWLAETFGARSALVVSGAVPLAAAAVIGVILARTGRLRLRVTPRRRGSWVTITPRVAGADFE